MTDRSTRFAVDTNGSSSSASNSSLSTLRSSSSSSNIRLQRRLPRSVQQPTVPQQQQQQQQLQPQPQPIQQRTQSQRNLSAFDIDFDLVGPLGSGLSSEGLGGANANAGSIGRDIKSQYGHPAGGASNTGFGGHPGSTSVKSAVLRSSPSYTSLIAAKHASSESKAEPRHVSNSSSSQQYQQHAGNNSITVGHATNSTARRTTTTATTAHPRSDDHLLDNDLEAAIPFFVDFGGGNEFGGTSSRESVSKNVSASSGASSRIIKSSTFTSPGREVRRSTSTAAADATPALEEGARDTSLSILDDFFAPTLTNSGPATKSNFPRDKQEPNQYQQQQQQQPALQQSHLDSSLDFFSSLENSLPSSSSRSFTRSSSSSAFAQLSSPLPLPGFPSLAADYSSMGRGNSYTRTAPSQRTSQSNTNVATSLEPVPPSSAPLSPVYGPPGLAGTLDNTNSPLNTSVSSTGQQRRKCNNLAKSPFPSASLTATTSFVSGSPSGQGSRTFLSAPSTSSDSMPAVSVPHTGTTSPVPAPSPDPASFSVFTSPKVTVAPKPPVRILQSPQHSPQQLTGYASGRRGDSLVQSQRQIPQQSISSRRVVPPSAPQTTPPPHAVSLTPALPQMPRSPWEDEGDFYQSADLTNILSDAIPTPAPISSPAPSPIPSASVPVTYPSPVPVPSLAIPPTVAPVAPPPLAPVQAVPPLPTSREPTKASLRPQPSPPKSPRVLDDPPQKQHQPAQSPKARKQSPPPLSPNPEKQARQEKQQHGQRRQNEPPKSPTMSPSVLTPALTKYPPPPPLILYSDDQITVSSLHLTIHSFYFPLNTPVTIPLLSITEVEALPAEDGGNSGGMASWLKYKNWGVAALSDIWWARDPRRATPGGGILSSTLGAAAAAVVPMPAPRSGNKENTAPLVHVVVRVEGEWLRKGFGVEHERGVKILKDAWKNVKESELGLRPLRPATVGPSVNEEGDGLAVEKPLNEGSSSGGSNGGGSSEKRRWLSYQNTWTAYPFADDSPQFLAQQQRRGAGMVGGIGSTLSSKAPRHLSIESMY
ncbi:hypothetical protein BGX28_002919 [Mortierella sp. GBA30]|nr:hypothetical protein BGX28_002919 [Mortierella sp. GBA30]